MSRRTHFVDGTMSEMRGDNDAALTSFLKAVDLLDRDRRALHDERSRGTFAEDRINFYYAAVQQLLQRGRHAEAFEMLERSRSRALADLLASRRPGFGHAEEQKLYADAACFAPASPMRRARRSSGEPARRREECRSPHRAAGPDSSPRGSGTGVMARMVVEAPRLQNLIVSSPATLAALQQSMRAEHYELVQYLVLEHAVIVWHIGPDSVTVRNVFSRGPR